MSEPAPTAWDTTWVWDGRVPPLGIYLHPGHQTAPEDVLLSSIEIVVGPEPDLEATYKVALEVNGRGRGEVTLLPGQGSCMREFMEGGKTDVIVVPQGSHLKVQIWSHPESSRVSTFYHVEVMVTFLCVGAEMIELLNELHGWDEDPLSFGRASGVGL